MSASTKEYYRWDHCQQRDHNKPVMRITWGLVASAVIGLIIWCGVVVIVCRFWRLF